MLLIGEKGRFLQTSWRLARGFAFPLAITIDMDVKRAKLMILFLEWTVNWGGRKEALEYLDAIGDKYGLTNWKDDETDELDEVPEDEDDA